MAKHNFHVGDTVTHQIPAVRTAWGDRYRILDVHETILRVKPLDKKEPSELTFAALDQIKLLESALKDTFETDGIE
jgi:hypothetical protein